MNRLLSLSAAALLLPAVAVAIDDQDGTPDALSLTNARLTQAGKLRLTIDTGEPIDLRLLRPGRGYLCLLLSRGTEGPVKQRLCIRRSAKSNHLSFKGVEGEVKRTGARTIKASFLPQSAGVTPGDWNWSVVAAAGRNGKPSTQSGQIRVRRARAVGCKRHGDSLVFHGPRNLKRIALTFDDGPSSYTAPVAKLLKAHGAHATFFELGTNTGGHARTMRNLLAAGNEIANHTYNHASVGGGGPFAAAEINHTNHRIKAMTGYRPCLFRAPGGAIGPGLISVAQAAGMSTIQWDVDPTDWGLPGSSAIYSRVVNEAGAGSIVLMHDGGGPRSQTVDALGPILRTLTKRGYELVTVSRLLGYETHYSSR